MPALPCIQTNIMDAINCVIEDDFADTCGHFVLLSDHDRHKHTQKPGRAAKKSAESRILDTMRLVGHYGRKQTF
jgi:hypothetical protein